MARNEEKAMAMLNRWTRQKSELHHKKKERPVGVHSIKAVTNVGESDRWRQALLKEINKKVTKIQNAGLGEAKIREMNDEINSFLKELKLWEERILELGGPDYKKISREIQELEGSELPGFQGYKYFGAAKDLPGVRDLFQKAKPQPPDRHVIEIFKNIDFEEYLGKKTDFDMEDIQQEEQKIEDMLKQQELEKWISENREVIEKKLKPEQRNNMEYINKLIENEAYLDIESDEEKQEQNKQQQQLEKNKQTMLDERKRLLLEKYLVQYDDEKPVQNDKAEKKVKIDEK